MNEIDKDKFRVSRRNTCTWLAPKGVTFWHTDKGVPMFTGPWCIAISTSGIALLDDSRICTVTDYTIHELKLGIDFANEIYMSDYFDSQNYEG